jgi:FtsZ-interacting cell division protein ZipA
MVLLGGIWWWGSRRPSQARGVSELRESDGAGATSGSAAEPMLSGNAPPPAAFSITPVVREPRISPYEPLRISTHESDDSPNGLDIPVMTEPEVDSQIVELEDVHLHEEPNTDAAGATTTLLPPDPLHEAIDPNAQTHPGAHTETEVNVQSGEPTTQVPPHTTSASGRFAVRRDSTTAAPRTDVSGRFSRVKPEPPKPIQLQKILTLRICAVADTTWAGEDLALALSGSDLVHGRYGVFHRLHADGRSVFCVASLVEPGSFEPAQMPQQRFPGISLFAVLPGPMEPMPTLEALLETARQLAQDLSGMMQDEQGQPLSPQRAGRLREEVVQFQQAVQASGSP